MHHHAVTLTASADVAAYMTAGRAVFTLVSHKTNRRYTFRMRKGAKCFFIDAMVGPDNVDDYEYLGSVHNLNGEVFNRKRPAMASDPRAHAINWLLRQLNGDKLPETVEFFTSGKCAVCGRALTTPESVARGIGPKCFERL